MNAQINAVVMVVNVLGPVVQSLINDSSKFQT